MIRADATGAIFAYTDYCGVAGGDEVAHDGIFPFLPAKPIRLKEISGGLSNTFIFGERPPNPVEHGTGMWLGSQWTVGATMSVTNGGNVDGYPEDCGPLRFQNGLRFNDCSAFHHWSYHPSGGNFSRADGSVAFARYDIDTVLLKELGSRN